MIIKYHSEKRSNSNKLEKRSSCSTANKGWSMVNHCQSLAFDHPYYHVMIIVTGDFTKKTFFNIIFRSSHMQMFFKTGVIRNFAVFTEKHLVLKCLFNKVADLMACNFFWSLSESSTQVFYCEYCKIFTKSIFYRTPLVAAFVILIK